MTRIQLKLSLKPKVSTTQFFITKRLDWKSLNRMKNFIFK